jgi:hypothetical protein
MVHCNGLFCKRPQAKTFLSGAPFSPSHRTPVSGRNHCGALNINDVTGITQLIYNQPLEPF